MAVAAKKKIGPDLKGFGIRDIKMDRLMIMRRISSGEVSMQIEHISCRLFLERATFARSRDIGKGSGKAMQPEMNNLVDGCMI